LYLGNKLLPSKVSSLSDEELEAIEEYYGPVLPYRSTFQGEVEKWKTKAKDLSVQDYTVSDTLKLANLFPNNDETHTYYSCGCCALRVVLCNEKIKRLESNQYD
jgi:hypothetical protein